MPVKGQRHYGYLLNDQSVRRWYDNVARGSRITADVYLRRLGGFLESEHLTQEFVRRATDARPEALIVEGTNIGEAQISSEDEVKEKAGIIVESSSQLSVASFASGDTQRINTFCASMVTWSETT